MNVLAVLLALPLIGFFVVLASPRDSKLPFFFAIATSLAAFFVSLGLIGPVLAEPAHFTSVLNLPWIDSTTFQIRFHLGIDGINIWLILLTTVLIPIGVWISQTQIRERHKGFYALLMLFEFGLIGVFSAVDLFVFYVFWEVALVPMYLMVGSWGGSRRGFAAVKFFVYTMLGSVLMLGSIIYLYSFTGTSDYQGILNVFSSGRITLSPGDSVILFLGFFAAFAIKVPIFPLHAWLPITYVEAPAPATFLLAAVMSKMGAYGLLRFCIPLFPVGARRCADWIVILAIIGIIYGALLALVQPNIKRLIAYSSISHLGFIVLGIFTFSQNGVDG
ncbi:MAG TPA: NADH-quinone oxidoreductase subunit M, partial [Bryobacteraceae bacterium]|nr:NADH-quinone oxidoreductase subunit M [Bryobacteraceae bacterium]